MDYFTILISNLKIDNDKESYLFYNFEKIIQINKKTLISYINLSEYKHLFIKLFKHNILESNEYLKNKTINLINLLEVDSKEDFLFFSSYANLQFLFNNYYKFEFDNNDKLLLQNCYLQFNFFNDNTEYIYPQIYNSNLSNISLFKIEVAKSVFQKTNIIIPFLKIDVFVIFFHEEHQEELFNYFLEYFQYLPSEQQIEFAFNIFFTQDETQLYKFIFPKKLYDSFLCRYLFLTSPLYQKIQNIVDNNFKNDINLLTEDIHRCYIEKYNTLLQLNNF